FAAAATTPAHAADPCTFLTTAQVTAAMGTPVNDGTPGPKNCIWHATKRDGNVYITLRDSASFATFKSQAQSAGHLVPASGLGDDAFFVTGKDSAALYVLKGSQVLLIMARITGNTSDQNQAIEKALAAQAITHL
ncbi:MAG TPA: hypothetical protein VK813_11505, partial [Edaphobacter sp.]|nr:hypothetical protein [Edaphobacter sp.]